jgi:hypothetical protein
MTTPSAGAITAFSSPGVVRCGLRKKKIVKIVKAAANRAGRRKWKRARTAVIQSAPMMKGKPSTAMGVFSLRIKCPQEKYWLDKISQKRLLGPLKTRNITKIYSIKEKKPPHDVP